MFDDRTDAGKRLAGALEHYKDRDVLVLAIPRGGVEVGFRVAEELNADFSIIISRKLPFPDNPESGFGAVTEDGSMYLYPAAESWVGRENIERIVARQKEEIERRIAVLRKGRPLPSIADRTVILVDDGIAMGSTMRASIKLCKNRNAGRIVVAAPVAGERVVQDIKQLVDEIVILEVPPFFRAVAQVYRNWYDVTDEEVLAIMESQDKNRKIN